MSDEKIDLLYESILKRAYRGRVFCNCLYGKHDDKYHHELLKEQGFKWFPIAMKWGIENERFKKRFIREQEQYQKKSKSARRIFLYSLVDVQDKENIDKDMENKNGKIVGSYGRYNIIKKTISKEESIL